MMVVRKRNNEKNVNNIKESDTEIFVKNIPAFFTRTTKHNFSKIRDENIVTARIINSIGKCAENWKPNKYYRKRA